MITPQKHMNLNLSVLNISALCLSILQDIKAIKYDELLNQVIESKGENVKYNFCYSLDLLYLLGKIEYHSEIDAIEIVR